MTLNIGLAICGSFCTLGKVLEVAKQLVDAGYNVIPILSYNVASMDTRFFKASDFRQQIEQVTGNKCIDTIQKAEPIGPNKLIDAMLVLPLTGNTMAKIAGGITDTPVTMAVKAHLRNHRPVILAVSTNDGLSASATNLGILLNRKHIYFVPFSQDDPIKKPNSLVSHFDKVIATIEHSMKGIQIQPIITK